MQSLIGELPAPSSPQSKVPEFSDLVAEAKEVLATTLELANAANRDKGYEKGAASKKRARRRLRQPTDGGEKHCSQKAGCSEQVGCSEKVGCSERSVGR